MFDVFSIFKKKPAPKTERKPLNLPEVPADKMNPADIVQMLSEGTPIWTWTSIMDKYNYTAMLNMQGNCLDGFAMFRKEEDLLIKYVGVIGSDKKMIMKITEVQLFKNSNIMELFETELKDAYRVYYDDEHLTENLSFFCYDVTYDEMKKYLEGNRVMYISEDHFMKKPEAVTAESEEEAEV
ncbi:hypothetical protein SAMN02745229_03914 [Butyrivibrio fibrisolvens DSM 3071]|uniref:Uncharacterized protein n=1 Tax=Butyrivibrio fibrisolvens DSM 3071 TaxID=1121131 RepID=A0A1M6FHI3_BUTFI|nr:hypothetical protein [Butyrivibrio fibrisolvens]SHI97089.1 hypothetical protein SAMN02745229_03914 [Butyrivibrio fibrisolvens DSM 3071]